MIDQAIQVLVARLLTHRFIERTDPVARRALVDPTFREAVEERLSQVGLVLLENPYADYIAVALKKDMEEFVFGDDDDGWVSNNMGLPRDAIALLVVLWALIILPKREKQIARNEGDHTQDMFDKEKKVLLPQNMAPTLSEEAVYADFGKLLGGKMRFTTNLGQLTRLGFIHRRNKTISEGPLLDLMLDYATLAPRIIEGALKQVLGQQRDNDVSDS
jgi:hypothetical protein